MSAAVGPPTAARHLPCISSVDPGPSRSSAQVIAGLVGNCSPTAGHDTHRLSSGPHPRPDRGLTRREGRRRTSRRTGGFGAPYSGRGGASRGAISLLVFVGRRRPSAVWSKPPAFASGAMPSIGGQIVGLAPACPWSILLLSLNPIAATSTPGPPCSRSSRRLGSAACSWRP